MNGLICALTEVGARLEHLGKVPFVVCDHLGTVENIQHAHFVVEFEICTTL